MTTTFFESAPILNERDAHDLTAMQTMHRRMTRKVEKKNCRDNLEVPAGHAIHVVGPPKEMQSILREMELFASATFLDPPFGGLVCTITTSRAGFTQVKTLSYRGALMLARNTKAFTSSAGRHALKNTLKEGYDRSFMALTRVQLFSMPANAPPRGDIMFALPGDRAIQGADFKLRFASAWMIREHGHDIDHFVETDSEFVAARAAGRAYGT